MRTYVCKLFGAFFFSVVVVLLLSCYWFVLTSKSKAKKDSFAIRLKTKKWIWKIKTEKNLSIKKRTSVDNRVESSRISKWKSELCVLSVFVLFVHSAVLPIWVSFFCSEQFTYSLFRSNKCNISVPRLMRCHSIVYKRYRYDPLFRRPFFKQQKKTTFFERELKEGDICNWITSKLYTIIWMPLGFMYDLLQQMIKRETRQQQQ